jgi:hypothetical protein
MARVLPGTAPHLAAKARADLTPATTWIESHYDDLRGQWGGMRLENPVLVASAPTLRHLWQKVSPAQLTDCLLQYVYTVEAERQLLGPWWEG